MYNCWNEAVAFVKKHTVDGRLKQHAPVELINKLEVIMRQYYYGIEAKKELWYCLVYDCGVIPESKDPMLN